MQITSRRQLQIRGLGTDVFLLLGSVGMLGMMVGAIETDVGRRDTTFLKTARQTF